MNDRQTTLGMIERGAYGRAVSLLQRWLQENPYDFAAHRDLVSTFKMKGDGGEQYWRKCNEAYSHIFAGSRPAVLDHFVRGEQAFNDDSWDVAAKEYELAIDAGAEED